MALPLGSKVGSSSYASSNQVYGSSQPKWNSGTGLSGYDSSRKYSPSTSLISPIGSSSNSRTASYPNGYRQNEGTPSFNTPGPGSNALSSSFSQPFSSSGAELATLNSNSGSGSTPWRSQSLYNTGEPLGKLSAAMLDRARPKFAPSRDAMKDKLVNTLSSDTNIAILPGCVKSYEETKMSASRQPVSLNNGASHSWYAERVPSPVARAQAALSDMQEKVGKAQTMVRKNTGKAAGLYRDPKNPGILGGIPGIGDSQYSSVRQMLDKGAYRRDLERQIEEHRIQKETEKNEFKHGTHHPFGPGYDSHNMYTDMVAAERNRQEVEKFASYLKVKNDTVGQASPARPIREQPAEKVVSVQQEDQAQANPQQIPNGFHYPHSQVSPIYPPTPEQQQHPGYPQTWYGPAGFQQPAYGPTSYQQPQYNPPAPQQSGYAPPAPQQQAYAPPPPQHPRYAPASTVQRASARQIQQPSQPKEFSHYRQPSGSIVPGLAPAPIKSILRRPNTPGTRKVNMLSPRKPPALQQSTELEFESDAEIDESVFITKKWQTSDQLPDPALKRAAYQLALKKQIIEKQGEAEKRRLKELEDEELLERKNAEYNEEMRKRLQAETRHEHLNQLVGHTTRLHVTAPIPNIPSAQESTANNALSPRDSKPFTPPWHGQEKGAGRSVEKLRDPQIKRNMSHVEHGGGDVARVHRVPDRRKGKTARVQREAPRHGKSAALPPANSLNKTDEEFLRIMMPAHRGDDPDKEKPHQGLIPSSRAQSILDLETKRMDSFLHGKERSIPKSYPVMSKIMQRSRPHLT